MSRDPAAPHGWFRLLYVACIVALSIETMTGARAITDHHFWLAAIEMAGALLLLLARLEVAGMIVLLAVYALAFVVTLHVGELAVHLVLFAGTVIYLVRGRMPPPVAPQG